jgi:hypothetical protein
MGVTSSLVDIFSILLSRHEMNKGGQLILYFDGFLASNRVMFERGDSGHVTPLLYDSVIHVPLLISAPQRRERRDFHTRTSNVDLLPTHSP